MPGHGRAAQSEVLPVWFDRRVSLTPGEQRRVQRLRDAVEAAATQVRAVRTPLGDLVTQIDSFLR